MRRITTAEPEKKPKMPKNDHYNQFLVVILRKYVILESRGSFYGEMDK